MAKAKIKAERADNARKKKAKTEQKENKPTRTSGRQIRKGASS